MKDVKNKLKKKKPILYPQTILSVVYHFIGLHVKIKIRMQSEL